MNVNSISTAAPSILQSPAVDPSILQNLGIDPNTPDAQKFLADLAAYDQLLQQIRSDPSFKQHSKQDYLDMLTAQSNLVEGDLNNLNWNGELSKAGYNDLFVRFENLNSWITGVVTNITDPTTFDNDMCTAEWDLAMFEVDAKNTQ